MGNWHYVNTQHPDYLHFLQLGDLFGMMTGILLFIIYLVATTFLVRHQFGDWHGELDPTFIDAFYFNFVTLSTTGSFKMHFLIRILECVLIFLVQQ